MGAVISFILLAWTAATWFSGPYDRPFLNSPLFGMSPLIPFTACLLWSLAVFFPWLKRHGRETTEKMKRYLHQHRKVVFILCGILVFHLVVVSGPAILNYGGENDSDSALHGLGGYHIAAGSDRPMYVYGIHYVGSFKAHVTALFNLVLGKNPMNQRAVGALFFLGFLVGFFIFVRRLFEEKTALLATAIAALPPFAVAAQLRYDEFIELPFWGIIGLNLLLSLCHETPRRGDPKKALRAIFRRSYRSAEDFHSSPGEANGLMNNGHEISHQDSHEDTRRNTKENTLGAQIGAPKDGPKGLLRGPAPRGLGGQSNWKYFFWYGVVLGLQFFAHPQAIYFILTGFLVIFAADKLFFLRRRNWLIPLGFIIGNIGTWVDSYYYDWVIIKYFFVREIENIMSLTERIKIVAGHLTQNFTEFWGLGPVFPFSFAVPKLLTAAVMFAALAGLIYYVYLCREEIKTLFSSRYSNVRRLIPLFMTAVVVAIFCLSKHAVQVGPFRYMYGLWLVIPVVIAAGAMLPKSVWGKYSGRGFLAISLILFSLSQFQYIKVTQAAEHEWQNWLMFCREKKITHFYGDFWLVYNSNFISKEEIIGSACFPENNDPYTKYRGIVDSAAKPPAYVFSPKLWSPAFQKAVWFKKALVNLGIRYKFEKIGSHLVFYNLSEHLTPAQLVSLPLENKIPVVPRVTVDGFSLREITGGKGLEGLGLVTFHCRNGRESALTVDGSGATAELVITAADGSLLRRQPLDKNVFPGEPFDCQVLLSPEEMKGQPVPVHIKLNDIITSAGKQPFIFRPADLEMVKPADQAQEVKSVDLSLLQGRLRPGQLPEFLLIDGWGDRLRETEQVVQWSGGKQSEIAFLVTDPAKEMRVMLLLSPFKDKKSMDRPQSVQFFCNDMEIRGIFPLKDITPIHLKLAPGMLRLGINRLKIKPLWVEPEYHNIRWNPNFNYRPRAFALHSFRFSKPGSTN